MTLKTLQGYKQDKELKRRTWGGADLVEKKRRDILLPIACPCVSKEVGGRKKKVRTINHGPWRGSRPHRSSGSDDRSEG